MPYTTTTEAPIPMSISFIMQMLKQFEYFGSQHLDAKKSLKKSLMSNIYRLQRTKLQAIETNQIDISTNIYL